MGLRFEQGRHCDNGICAVGRWDLVKIWAGNGIGSPLRTLYICFTYFFVESLFIEGRKLEQLHYLFCKILGHKINYFLLYSHMRTRSKY